MTGFLKNAEALPVETITAQGVFVVIAEYDHSTSKSVAYANAVAALATRLLLFDTDWDDDNGGLYESTTTTGIASVAAGDGSTKHPAGTGYTELATDIVITPARAWEETDQTPHEIWPILLFNDTPVPLSRVIKIGDGFTAGDLVIIVDNTSGDYNTTATNWKLILARPMPEVMEIDMGGITLAQTTEQKRLLGFTDSVSERTTNDGESGSGSITFAEAIGKWEVANGRGAAGTRELLNNPGEEVEKAIYGAQWTAGSMNELTYQNSSKRLVVALVEIGSSARFTGNSAAEQKKVFAKVVLHVGCRVTGFENLGNLSSDSNDFVAKQVSLEWSSVYKKVFRTVS